MRKSGGSSGRRSQSDLSADLLDVGRGDHAAFCRVYEATAGKLFALCFRITCNRSGAEDVLQETFIKVWNRAPGFDPERSAAFTWLSAIARNSAIDWYRAHHRRIFVGENAISFVADEAATADDRIIREQEELRALELLGELPPDQEAELRNVFFLGLTYTELAEREGLPVNTLKSRIRRGLLALKRKFEDG